MTWANGLDLEIAVNNVTGAKGYNFVFTGESGNAQTFGDPRYQRQRALDRPRTIWLTLRKRFGSQ
jgi:hypothetical protein